MLKSQPIPGLFQRLILQLIQPTPASSCNQGWTEKIEKGAVRTLVSKINIIYFIRIHEKITEGKVAAVHLADPLIRPAAYSVS